MGWNRRFETSCKARFQKGSRNARLTGTSARLGKLHAPVGASCKRSSTSSKSLDSSRVVRWSGNVSFGSGYLQSPSCASGWLDIAFAFFLDCLPFRCLQHHLVAMDMAMLILFHYRRNHLCQVVGKIQQSGKWRSQSVGYKPPIGRCHQS